MRPFFFLGLILATFIPQMAMAAALSPAMLRAIEEEDWGQAQREASGDRALLSYVQWRLLLDDASVNEFSALANFIEKHSDWPRLNVLKMRAEKALFQGRDDSARAAQWLSRYPPVSGYGLLAQARVSPEGDLIRRGWIQGDFERGDEMQIRKEFGKWLDTKTHEMRAERLLFEGKASVAERLLGDVPPDVAKLMRARIALQRFDKGVDTLVDAVPSTQAKDNGLLADRALWRHKKGNQSGARELLLAMHPNSSYADALWRIRASYARDAIEAGDYASAKRLLDTSGSQLDAANNADALWLNGWLHLRFLKQPKRAYQLFEKLYGDVNYPVSKSRGAFWAGRAAERNGDKLQAQSWYENAAKHPTTFYGQLAYARLNGKKPLALPAVLPINSTAKSQYSRHDLWRLAEQFYKAGESRLAASLLYALAETAQSSEDYTALMDVAQEAKLPHAQVIISKLAMRKHVILPQGWPIIAPPADAPLPAELALAISRQESEFNPQAVSHANARGLMQLLPSTARKTAEKIGIEYSLERLFDPVYNMRLGSQYLGDLIRGFDGNYILAIAGYNAGPGRSRQWVERFGWPGKNLDDTLTFLELIPFSETRNYVQRVLENTQVYRARLKPSSPLMIEQDLLR